MNYQNELERLQKIIVSDNSTSEQRDAARQAKKKLIDANIEGLFRSLESRTSKYTLFIERLKSIIDKIETNKLTGLLDEFDEAITDIGESAAANDEPSQ